MRKLFSIFLCLLAFLGFAQVFGQGQNQDFQSPELISPAPNKLFSQVSLKMKDARVFTGLLIGLEGDAIVLRIGRDESRFPRNVIALLTKEPRIYF